MKLFVFWSSPHPPSKTKTEVGASWTKRDGSPPALPAGTLLPAVTPTQHPFLRLPPQVSAAELHGLHLVRSASFNIWPKDLGLADQRLAEIAF